MDPKQGRIALVGHIRAAGPRITGPLSSAEVRETIQPRLQALAAELKSFREVQGTVSFRLRTAPTGVVDSIHVLMDSLIVPVSGYGSADVVTSVRQKIREALAALRFPNAAESSEITLSVLVPLPSSRPIEIAVAHALPVDSLAATLSELLQSSPLELFGRWVGREFIVSGPADGTIRLEDDRIRASFAAPMWVASQRAKFELDLKQTLDRAATTGTSQGDG